MKKIITFSLFFILACFLLTAYLIKLYHQIPSFWTSKGTIKKELHSEKLVTKFHIDDKAIHPYARELIMKGYIDGKGELYIGVPETYLKMDTIQNEFEIKYHGDWYGDTCYVSFEPIDMTYGELLIDYKIHSSKKVTTF
ncbi:hypothetical protein KMW28_17155 [Flammeovirga yaeyamensis]|uniref:Lipoprotein n=1 Tax=Flammeovirga yaeyamensis TaxID=367791 RepID=A0AAX1N6E4_9BACT|nr:hypothetical protein [Flammeovirga yaeyamensis]MBB3698253.1 hypothetical protein [Flammeovirga yaeyamensis]NMF34392.1 hypothetical protein [Flammeovirga yaeyamensis]QWG01373.1 hypothetical protein KMW28_17155 [Flammeovirga yaeyamensis]